jgi:hypothetical protein
MAMFLEDVTMDRIYILASVLALQLAIVVAIAKRRKKGGREPV